MAKRKYWIGTAGPFFTNDTLGAIRFEDAATTHVLGTLAGQSASSVDIGGGNIDDTVIGSSTAAAGSFTTATVSNFVLQGATETISINDAGFATATELAWVEVVVGTTTGYLRVYAAK
jgi:hypothetical protein